MEGRRAAKAGCNYLLKHTTNTVKASCTAIVYRVDPANLHRHVARGSNSTISAEARLTLFKPIPVGRIRGEPGTMGSLILIDPVSNATVGAGMIIERLVAPVARSSLDEKISLNVAWQPGKVSGTERVSLLGHEPFTVWMTGLSGSGKSTLAFELERRLIEAGHACFVLDGDNIRHGLSRDLGFSPADRRENIRRVAEGPR